MQTHVKVGHPRHVHPPRLHFPHQITDFIHKNAVLVIALTAALSSSLLVPPDSAYLSYFDFKTLTCLFCTLAVICALKNIHFFTILARKIVRCAGNTRSAVLALVCITFIGSMLIANDMALLTFLPLGYLVLSSTGREKYMALTFILQNIAANLGGMLTPFGNPQNLYLYSRFNIPNGEFMRIMAIPFAVSIVLIFAICFFIPREPLTVKTEEERLPVGRTVIYLLLFASSILIVFGLIPYPAGLLLTLVLLPLDRDALKKVDYPLLLTFVCFFIFAGNMSRIEIVRDLFSALLEKSTLLTAVISCQCISNVPSAILLSQFTENYPALLIGVNIGGAGTLIASLASLITFRTYTTHYPEKARAYIGLFTLLNFGFLAVLTVISCFLV